MSKPRPLSNNNNKIIIIIINFIYLFIFIIIIIACMQEFPVVYPVMYPDFKVNINVIEKWEITTNNNHFSPSCG